MHLLTQTIEVRWPAEIEGASGLYDGDKQTIDILSTCGYDQQRETLLHESLHAMLAYTHLDALLDEQNEGASEHLVSALAPIMLSWIRENPRIMRYLEDRL